MWCGKQTSSCMRHLFQGIVLIFQLHDVLDLLLLVLVAQQVCVRVRQLVQLVLAGPVLVEQRVSLGRKCVELFLEAQAQTI